MVNPSTEPITELILQDLEAAVASISQTHPTVEYWTDIAQVVRRDAGDPTINVYPTVIVTIDGNEVSDDLDSGFNSLNTENLMVMLEVQMKSYVDVALLHQHVIRDVRTAIMQDPTRGGIAIHTFVESTKSWYPTATDPLTIVDINIRVAYRTHVGDLEMAG